jgi:23S rRNA (guanine745-N1)-methyltransferase
MARSGYVNLLQPQDRRSPAAGDSAAVVAARAALWAAGVGRAVVDACVARARALDTGSDLVVVDLGSGTGVALGALAAGRQITGIGIDLSTAAASHAARRYRHVTWVVANADRRLPVLGQSADLVLSLHGRRNPPECARVLRPSGRLLVALPAADDVTELRGVVQGASIQRARADGLIDEHAPWFLLVDRFTVAERHRLERAMLLHLLRSTYRGARTSSARGLAALDTLDVTLASEVCCFQPASL